MLLLETIDIIPLPIVVISGVLFGAGSAIGIMAWTSMFWIEGDRAMCEILAASLFACVIGLVLASNNGIVATLLTCVLLSVVSCACALYLFKDGYESGQVGCRGGLQDETVYQCVLRIARLVWKPGLCIGALGLISAISRSLVSSHSTSTMVTLTMLGEIISCFVLLIFFSKRSLTIDTVSMYKVLFPLGALSFLLLTFLGERYTVVLAVIAEFSFHMCSVLMIPQALVYSGSLRVSPHIVYGLLGCIVYPILYLGYPISILSDNLFGSTPYPALAAVGIFILSMASFIGVRSRNPEGAQPDNADICADMSVFEGAGISQRERQIIGLLLEGRDVPYISEMLCVSKNTVRTHVKSAYSKLGVHSKQELIDLCRESQKPL